MHSITINADIELTVTVYAFEWKPIAKARGIEYLKYSMHSKTAYNGKNYEQEPLESDTYNSAYGLTFVSNIDKFYKTNEWYMFNHYADDHADSDYATGFACEPPDCNFCG